MYTSLPLLAVLLGLYSLVAGSKLEQVLYWGQSLQQGPLSQYCAPSLGVDTINLAFVFQFGDSNPIFGNLGDCNITLSGPHPSPECQQVARDIEYCQSQETKILLSFGGGVGNYGLNNQSEAEAFATQVWELFGPVKNGYKGPRPLGDSVIDGVDLDIESSKGVFNYGFFVWRLRELFNTDLSKRYYITASPQCVVPDANMGDVIFNAPIDYLFVQYYNTRQCSARGHISGYLPVDGRNQYFTFPAWAEFTSTSFSQSAHAKIFIGLPASPTAAISNEDYFLKPEEALELVEEFKYHERFGGIMVWEAGASDQNVINGCTYSQQIGKIIHQGKIC